MCSELKQANQPTVRWFVRIVYYIRIFIYRVMHIAYTFHTYVFIRIKSLLHFHLLLFLSIRSNVYFAFFLFFLHHIHPYSCMVLMLILYISFIFFSLLRFFHLSPTMFHFIRLISDDVCVSMECNGNEIWTRRIRPSNSHHINDKETLADWNGRCVSFSLCLLRFALLGTLNIEVKSKIKRQP